MMVPFPAHAARRLMFLLAASVLVAACGSDPEPAGTVCAGAVRDGQCYQLCEDSRCLEGNACVFTEDRPEGYCTIPCQDNGTCPWGYACYSDVPDSSEGTGNYCLSLGLPDDGKPGTVCETTDQCDNGHGLYCFEGACTFSCSSILSTCPEGMMCKGDPGAGPGDPAGYCVTATPDLGIPGRYGSDCPFGDSQCDAEAGFVCVGTEGTTDAHCSKPDGCDGDGDCPTGYWCGAIRTVDDDGEIDFTKQPKTCLRRGFCHPCESDLDCGHEMNAICVPDTRGEKFCSTPCMGGTNSCIIGTTCEDVGDGRTACRPDVGYCYSKDPKGCDPCRIDSDCGPNAWCATGKWGYKPGINWCSTPCGPPDEHGKNPCPVAPNGQEMLCLDEHQYALGPFTSSDPGYLYKHCYAPLTVDNSELFPGSDPPNGVCGNGKVEEGEECDDGNKNPTRGCADCKVTPECTFKIVEPNGDGNPVVAPVPNHVKTPDTDPEPALPYVISTNVCYTFKVEGAIETPGDVDVVAIMLPSGADLWVSTYTSTPGACTADLVTEARAWKNGDRTTDEDFLDLDVPCEALSDAPEDYASTGTLCPGNTHLGCGTCDGPGVCGVCDDDNGPGNCTRMLVRTVTSFGSYPVHFDGRNKVLRVYAKDPAATVGNFVMVGSRFTSQTNFGPSTPVVLSCY